MKPTYLYHSFLVSRFHRPHPSHNIIHGYQTASTGGAEAYRYRIQRTVFTTPSQKNHKLYILLCSSLACTVCIMVTSLVFATYCPFAFNCPLFYHIHSHSLVSCSPFWVGLDSYIASKRHLFRRPVHPRCLAILPTMSSLFLVCFV